MDGVPVVPGFGDLIDRVFVEVPHVALHGSGHGVDRSSADDGQVVSQVFAFAYTPPDRWRLERPPGRLRAVGDGRREVEEDRAGQVRRTGVGLGWHGEPACWLLRPSQTGVILAEWHHVTVLEPPKADVLLGRPCWRVTQQVGASDARLWFDDELPLLLRISGGDLLVELDELYVGSVGNRPVEHPLLAKDLFPPLDPVPEGAEALLSGLRAATPEALSIELCQWDGAGAFVARLMIPTDGGDAEVIVDRRSRNAPPYERTHAAMLRGGDARWTISVDYDPQVDKPYARDLAARIPPAGD